MYDPHSARLLRSTDWRRHGALRNPPSSIRQWGAPLNETELAALGQARLAAASAGRGEQLFWQHHPVDQSAFILCQANASTSPGWSIDLIGEDGNPTEWVLKADRGAALECACHCEWRPDCPGVVSVPAGGRREPPAPPPMVGMAEPSPSPRPSPAAPARASWRDRRRVRVAQHMGWAEPVQVAEPQQAAAVPDGWRWPSSAPASYAPVEADRGNLYAQQAESSPAWPAQYHLPDHAEPPTPSVEQADPPRCGWIAALFGGGAVAAAAVPAGVEAAAQEGTRSDLTASWNWPEPAGEEYRGELHSPQPIAIDHQAWQWPDAVSGSAVQSPQIEHYGEAWDVPALPAPNGGAMGWDAPEAVGGDPWPAYEASPAPDEAPRLSSQAEIDTFIDAAWETAPAIETDPHYDLPALPPPDVER